MSNIYQLTCFDSRFKPLFQDSKIFVSKPVFSIISDILYVYNCVITRVLFAAKDILYQYLEDEFLYFSDFKLQ